MKRYSTVRMDLCNAGHTIKVVAANALITELPSLLRKMQAQQKKLKGAISNLEKIVNAKNGKAGRI